jgi:hypothetical protein
MVAPASAPANCRFIRSWRIVEAGFWDRDHLHLRTGDNHDHQPRPGEIAFGALQAGLNTEYGRSSIRIYLGRL